MNPDYRDFYENCPCCIEKDRQLNHLKDHFEAVVQKLPKEIKESLEFHIDEILGSFD